MRLGGGKVEGVYMKLSTGIIHVDSKATIMSTNNTGERISSRLLRSLRPNSCIVIRTKITVTGVARRSSRRASRLVRRLL